MMSERIKVMVVDESALVRDMFSELFRTEPDMELIGLAQDPYIAVEKMKKKLPDVMILDIEIPRMDGLTFLRKIMNQKPIPVIIFSTLVEEGAATAMEALESGAVSLLQKPVDGAPKYMEENRPIFFDSAYDFINGI